MDLTLHTLILLPIGLGLLGFIEPCTIGGHLLFLDTQIPRSHLDRVNSVLIFTATRSFVAGLFGASIAFLGQHLTTVQTGIWLIFGIIYLTVGMAFLVGKGSMFKLNIDLAPAAWKHVKNPFTLGLAFGLNIPACAAPISFGLLGLAASTGTVLFGFAMMFLFGLFLSFPLVVSAVAPGLTNWLSTLGQKARQMRWLIGILFIPIGLWSVWFGLCVNPKDWIGQ